MIDLVYHGNMQILVTGCAGFIGSSLCSRLLTRGFDVIGVDNFAQNYPAEFKQQNIADLFKHPKFVFYKADICDSGSIRSIFHKHRPEKIVHLAALPGVRASLQNPQAYYKVNVLGSKKIYEIAAQFKSISFTLASSSSVYGNSTHVPFKEILPLNPLSPYAKTKQQAEQVLKTLHQKFKLPTCIVRLFSVFGPRGRPDMAPYIFTEAAFNQTQVEQFGDGSSARDFTYINDVVDALVRALDISPQWEIINIGNSSPVTLLNLIRQIEIITRKKLKYIPVASLPHEANITYADISKAARILKWKPKTQFAEGMAQFINWYKKNRINQK